MMAHLCIVLSFKRVLSPILYIAMSYDLHVAYWQIIMVNKNILFL